MVSFSVLCENLWPPVEEPESDGCMGNSGRNVGTREKREEDRTEGTPRRWPGSGCMWQTG